ncbi:MAG: succinate dehydrogenase, cytochrome b556 subunit [Methylococcales bacterium]|nr:succinate dehydrogenase, cytochrome b556 subunit [Methylococcales bacterium]
MVRKNSRPISPHLQVYRLPLTGIISITHRMTGVILSVGLIFFVYLLHVILAGPVSYLELQSFMQQWLAKLVYWGFIYALFFHLCHGVRHLVWDAGKSFDRETLNRYALVELTISLLLTLIIFLFI